MALPIAMRGQTHLQLATEQSKLYGVGNLDAVARKARELQVGGHLIITAGHQQMWKDGQKKVTVMKRDGVFALNDGWESGAVDLGTAQTFFNRTVKTCPGTSMTASQIAAAARAAMKG